MMPAFNWPKSYRCAFVLTVLFDDGLDAVAKEPSLLHRNKSFSTWKYGATRGVERLCEAFAEADIKSTWFVPGLVALNHARLLRSVAAANHALESHGWNFERHDELSPENSTALLGRSREVLEEISGARTTGFRLPVGHWPRHMAESLRSSGYLWSASLNGDDVPYQHANGLVEIPVHIELEDRPYFQFSFSPAIPKGLSRISSYENVLNNWIAEFDAYRRYGLCFVLQLRPEMTGTPGRIFLVKKLLDYIRQFDDVWLASGREVANWHIQHGRPIEKNHPLNVFAAYERECNERIK
jgi:peptidoglycan/xylan/chitin deacetylase (PgdA/CDA1 family)